jgi:hypothetical protein
MLHAIIIAVDVLPVNDRQDPRVVATSGIPEKILSKAVR